MKTISKFKWLFAALCMVLNMPRLLAQTKTEVFDGKTPVTWLGLDYTHAKYILPEPDLANKSGPGYKTQKNNAPDSTTTGFIKKYISAWNYLFMAQPRKFDVAKATHRTSVDNALGVTEKANNAINTDLVSKNPADFKKLTAQNISELVKNYDFEGKTGIGLLFFIEGMSREKAEEGAWVTFVDMSSKTVLYTTYLTGETGGMGFRNNWADATFRILKRLETDKNWRK